YKEKMKNDKSFKVNQSNEFYKEREQYFKIQDLKAQLQDKGIMISKPTIFSDSLERKDFSKSKSVTQNNVSNDFSKPDTAQTLSPNKKSILKNTNVLAPGMYKLHTELTQTRTSHLPQDSRKTNKRDVEDHRRSVKFSKNKTSVTACNNSLKAKTLNVNFVCATCGKCVLNEKHDMYVLKSVNGVISRTKMPIVVPVSTRDPKHTVKQSADKPLKKTVASESNQKPKNITRKLYERVSKACRKSNISFLHVFGALCYPKNDLEDIGKLGAKAGSESRPPMLNKDLCVMVVSSSPEKKAKLFNEWERFTSNKGESIESYYHHFLKLMNDLKRNKHFQEKIASNLKFLNNLQPEWSRHVTIVHQTKDLHTADYTQLYDFLKYNQKEVDELKAERLAKTQDPLALMVIQNAVQNLRVLNVGNQNGLIGVQGNGNQNHIGNDGSVEVHENYDDNEIFNMFTQEEQYTKLLEPIPESHQVPQNDNHVIYEVTSVEQSGETVEQHPANFEETRALYDSLYQNLAIEAEKVNSSDFKTREDELLDKQIQLEKRIKELNNILVKTGQSIQTIHMLTPKPNSFYHTEQKMALGYQNPFYLKQAQKKQQSLYDRKVLLEKHDPLVVHDSEETLQLAQESREKMKQLNKEIKPANYTKINHLSGVFIPQTAMSREELYFSNNSKTANVSKLISIPNEDLSNDTIPSVARKFLNEVKSTIVTLQRIVKHKMTIETHNWSSSAHQELHKIVREEIFSIVNQVDARVQNFKIQFLKEAAKFVGDFKSLANKADASLAKHKALELEIGRLLKAVVSQDIMIIVQKESVVDTSNLQTELERTKERFENYIIKKETEYAKL
nr:hypothetical protein [Tanacetum cinerariifolium]